MGKTLPATASPRFTTSSRRPESTTSSWPSEIGENIVIQVFRPCVGEILVSLALKNKAKSKEGTQLKPIDFGHKQL
jgi:hypothetical protein